MIVVKGLSKQFKGQTVLNGGYIESSNGYAGDTLTLEVGHTLKGYGYLGGGYYGYNATSIVNKGIIFANNTLIRHPPLNSLVLRVKSLRLNPNPIKAFSTSASKFVSSMA